MKAVHWLSLLVLMLASLGALLWFNAQQAGEKSLHDGALLLADVPLAESLDSVAELRFTRASGDIVRLWHDPGQERWLVEQRGNYPADVDLLSGFLTQLTELKKEEAKTSRPEYHFFLGLNDPESGGQGVRVELVDEEGGVILNLILGNDARSREGLYARLASSEQSWLVAPPLEDFPDSAAGWLQRPLLDIDQERLRELNYFSDGLVFRLHRGNAGESMQAEMPAGFETAEDADLYSKAALLTDLGYDDALIVADATFTFTVTRSLEASSFDGLLIAIEVDENSSPEGPLLRFSFELDDTVSDGAEVIEEASRLGAQHSGWYYVVDADTADLFNPESFIELEESDDLQALDGSLLGDEIDEIPSTEGEVLEGLDELLEQQDILEVEPDR